MLFSLIIFCITCEIYPCPLNKNNNTFYLHLHECKKHITKSISIIIWAATSTRKWHTGVNPSPAPHRPTNCAPSIGSTHLCAAARPRVPTKGCWHFHETTSSKCQNIDEEGHRVCDWCESKGQCNSTSDFSAFYGLET